MAGRDMDYTDVSAALVKKGYSCLSAEFSAWEPISGGTGLLHCRRRRGRRHVMGLLLHKGRRYWYIGFPSPQVFLVRDSERLLEIVLGFMSGEIAYDNRLGLSESLMVEHDLFDVTRLFYQSRES